MYLLMETRRGGGGDVGNVGYCACVRVELVYCVCTRVQQVMKCKEDLSYASLRFSWWSSRIPSLVAWTECWAQIFKLFRNPGIDSQEPIPPGCVAWRAGTTTLFLSPIDCWKIPTLYSWIRQILISNMNTVTLSFLLWRYLFSVQSSF
jgi:hypothetical protein